MHASEMEHTGVSGMLHLTSETLNSLSYQFRNKLLIKERFDLDQTKTTYLVKKKHDGPPLIARLKSNKKDNEQDLVSFFLLIFFLLYFVLTISVSCSNDITTCSMYLMSVYMILDNFLAFFFFSRSSS